jgi:thymidylate kinase
MLITFSGLDGAGKTTLITELARALESSGRSVTRLTMYDDIGLYSVIRRIRGNPADLPKDPEQHRSAPREARKRLPRSVLGAALAVLRARFVKRLLLPLDVSFFLMKRARVMRTADVLILDRYFYDSLVELRGEAAWWGRAFLAVLPSPELSVFVDVDPAIAFSRKGEYDVPELSRRERAYRLLFGRLPHGVIIRNDSLSAAKAQLLKTVFDRLSCAA